MLTSTATESRTVQMVQMRMTALSSQTRVSCTTSTAAATETALTGGRCVMARQTVQQGTTKNIVKKMKPKYFMTPRMSALKMKKIFSMKIPGIPNFKKQVTKF